MIYCGVVFLTGVAGAGELELGVPHHRADSVLENSLDAFIPLPRVGWFQQCIQKPTMSEHGPINQHDFIPTL